LTTNENVQTADSYCLFRRQARRRLSVSGPSECVVGRRSVVFPPTTRTNGPLCDLSSDPLAHCIFSRPY